MTEPRLWCLVCNSDPALSPLAGGCGCPPVNALTRHPDGTPIIDVYDVPNNAPTGEGMEELAVAAMRRALRRTGDHTAIAHLPAPGGYAHAPRVLNPEAIGRADMTPIVQLGGP